MPKIFYPQAHRYTIVAFQPGVKQVIVIYFIPWEQVKDMKLSST